MSGDTHMTQRRAMAIIIAMALLWLCTPPARSGDLTVSFVTCHPGPQIYELCGHEAVRVRGEGIDSVWNYGLFDFTEPNFVYRFVKGETDYMVGGYPFEWFLPEYVARGSRVEEQDLNLGQEEARRFLAMLRHEALPENRRYRYNYVKDNCATRILELLDSAASARVIYPDSIRYGTFREEMRAYHRDYPWYQFGIDLALGSGLDRGISAREEMFVPVEMMRMADGARLADGRPLVRERRVLNEGVPDATLGPTPAYATPIAVSWAVFAIIAAICAWSLIRHRAVRWLVTLWFAILGIAGCVVAFLVFISSHEATSPNILIFWLNPLQLLTAACVWGRKTRPVALAMAIYNVVCMVCLLAVWPLQPQSANPAFFPLMGATLLVAASYAIIVGKESYNINKEKKTIKRRAKKK